MPCLVDRNGVQPQAVGALPPQLAALMQTNVNVQGLTVEAALTGRREHVYHAAMLDPHTAAELRSTRSRALVDDLLEAHGDWIPALEPGLRIVPRSAMNTEVFITCAVTGAGDTAGRSEHVPVTPAAIADSAIEAARAGAAIAHIHVRDPETGKGSRDVGLYREVVERVRAADVDVVLNLTAGMGGDLVLGSGGSPLPPDPDGTDMAGAEERLAHVTELRPEICTLDCGTMNFAAGGDYVMVNAPGMLRAMAERIQALGVRPELEVFDSGHLVMVHELIRDGLIDDPADDPALHGDPLRRARRSTDAARDSSTAPGRQRVLGLLDRPDAAPLRGAGGAGGRQRPRRARGQPLPLARQLATNGAARGAGGDDPRGR